MKNCFQNNKIGFIPSYTERTVSTVGKVYLYVTLYKKKCLLPAVQTIKDRQKAVAI